MKKRIKRILCFFFGHLEYVETDPEPMAICSRCGNERRVEM